MRLSFILLFVATLPTYATGIAQNKVTIIAKNEPLEKILSAVEKQTGYVFFFDEKILKDAKPVSVKAEDIPLEKFLSIIFENQLLKYSFRNKTITISRKLPPLQEGAISLFVLTTEIRGKVMANGMPVSGASVTIKPLNTGTATDEKGEFVLKNISAGNYTVEVSSVGYAKASRKITVGNSPVDLDFLLELEIRQEQEVVVSTGYSNKKAGELTGSVQRISGDMLRRGITSSDPASLLKGRVTGLYISEQNAGDPSSSGGQIFVRGQSSIAGVGVDQYNEFVMPALNYGPLLVVDGVIMPNQNLKDIITPQEIESINILKDAAATAIYGSRAAAGVLVVTTKRGTSSKPRVLAEVKYGVNQPNQGTMDFMNAQELYETQKRYYSQDYEINKAFLSGNYPTLASYLGYRLPSESDLANAYDWPGYAFRNSKTSEINLAASGGNDRTRYYMGASYYREEGTSVQNSLTRKTFRLNLETRLSDRFTATVAINGILNEGKSDPDRLANSLYGMIPWANPYNADGSLKPFLTYKNNGSLVQDDNPLFNKQYNYNSNNAQLLFGSFKLNYRITDWLNFSTTNSGNLNYNKNVRYLDVRTYSGGLSTFSPKGFLGTQVSNLLSYLSSNQLNFQYTVGDHAYRALVGMEYGKTSVESSTTNVNHVRPGYPVISLGGQIGPSYDYSSFGIIPTKAGNVEGGIDNKAIYSAFGELGYTYRSKYSVSGSVRTDASSSFGRDNRYGTFFSGGAAWIMSAEDFMKKLKWVNNLKWRLNYGTSGSQLGDNFLTETLYDPRYTYVGQTAANISVLGNPNLKWEVTKTISAGLEMEIFKRVTATVDYYDRRSENLLQKVQLPSIAGLATQWQNVATIGNKGLEILISSDNIVTKDFRWSTSFNISFNKNRIISVANDSLRQGFYNANSYYMFTGEDINSLKAVKYAGVDPQSGKPLFEKLLFDGKGNRTGTQLVNTLEEVGASSDSRQFQNFGSFQPRYFGGLTNTFSYKQFSLSVLITFAMKYVMNDGLAESSQGTSVTSYNQLKYVRNQVEWTNPGQTNATEPMLYYLNTYSFFGSSKYVHDASHAALRNVRLSYDLPQSLLNRLKLGNCSFYVSGDNLFFVHSKDIVASNFEGPSVGQAQNFGQSSYGVGIPRRYLIGVQLTF
ncbi:MAG: SusC/RagA family TonB-linked outer membrane protein [Chitinophagaceae bacterium]|nr:SusC/RagA family TonB-linked outer membrane protein [Chitinophagaceae bacterium]